MKPRDDVESMPCKWVHCHRRRAPTAVLFCLSSACPLLVLFWKWPPSTYSAGFPRGRLKTGAVLALKQRFSASKHKSKTQCWSQLVQLLRYRPDQLDHLLRYRPDSKQQLVIVSFFLGTVLYIKQHWINADLMLASRLRRRANVK